MIVNLRGTSGSGKSTIVKALLTKTNATPIYGSLGPRSPEAYVTWGRMPPVFVLGPYNVPTGGCDAILGRSGVAGVITMLDKYVGRGDLIFESLIISSMWGTIGKWLEDRKKDVILAPLDVTLKQCQEGLGDRHEAGRGKGDKTQEAHHFNTLKVCKKAAEWGFDVRFLDRMSATDTILNWLKR